MKPQTFTGQRKPQTFTGQRQAFLDGKPPVNVTKNKYNTFKVARCGRPSERLTEAQINQALRIATFDVNKQNVIGRACCPLHGKQALTYHYQQSDGVHVFCEVCNWTTHFDEYHYAPDEDEED